MKFKPSFESTLPTVDYFTRTKPEEFLRVGPQFEPRPLVAPPKVPDDLRDKHIHILGKTGYGKTTLLASWAVRDIRERVGGICVIDPKGGVQAFAEIVSRYIPEDRLDDCIWLDVRDPIPLDVISCDAGNEDAVVKDLSYILGRADIDKGNAPDLTSNIDNVIYTLLNANQNPRILEKERCTFVDIYRFFREPDRQKQILKYVTDPTLKEEWIQDKTYPNPLAVKRVTTRIDEYIRSGTLRTILGEPKPRLNIQEVIDNKKILLVTVPDEHASSSIYGSLLVSKIQQAAFSQARADTPEDDRTPFFLYIDEFEYFRASAAFAKMLKLARSFKLCLTLANLQLVELDPEIVSALGLISTYILLKIDPQDKTRMADIIGAHDDAEQLRKRENELYAEWSITMSEASALRLKIVREQLKSYPEVTVTIEDAIKLSKFEAIYKIGDDAPIRAPIPRPPTPRRPTEEHIRKLNYIKEHTKKHYGPTDANYAEIMKKRIGDIDTSQDADSMVELKDDGGQTIKTKPRPSK